MKGGIVEYCGVQRCGKSTKMVADLNNKVLPYYRPDEIFANFRLMIPGAEGITELENEDLMECIFETKRKKIRHRCFVFDEAGQAVMARGYANKRQTELVAFAWQMPKRGHILLYGSNPGNSTDVILRIATRWTVLPHFRKAMDRKNDYIVFTTLFNFECRKNKNMVLPHVWKYQEMFDSEQPIE